MLQKAIETLKSGGTIIYPTDTVYGLGCDARNEKAVQKIFSLKNRSKDQPVSVIGRLDVLEKICIIPDEVRPILEKHWPGALTGIFFPKGKRLPSQILDKEISVRIPNHPFVLELLNQIDFPIVSTSANISGESSPTKFSDIKIQSDLNIEGDEFVKGTPSTLVDFRQKPFKILRQGAVKI